ncbi:hypothetical protein HDU97_002399 [Phlyctochytrium planicorne]|nr:hypothetical protein HDU97_002399 [Phlyctochytrium planicorne]
MTTPPSRERRLGDTDIITVTGPPAAAGDAAVVVGDVGSNSNLIAANGRRRDALDSDVAMARAVAANLNKGLKSRSSNTATNKADSFGPASSSSSTVAVAAAALSLSISATSSPSMSSSTTSTALVKRKKRQIMSSPSSDDDHEMEDVTVTISSTPVTPDSPFTVQQHCGPQGSMEKAVEDMESYQGERSCRLDATAVSGEALPSPPATLPRVVAHTTTRDSTHSSSQAITPPVMANVGPSLDGEPPPIPPPPLPQQRLHSAITVASTVGSGNQPGDVPSQLPPSTTSPRKKASSSAMVPPAPPEGRGSPRTRKSLMDLGAGSSLSTHIHPASSFGTTAGPPPSSVSTLTKSNTTSNPFPAAVYGSSFTGSPPHTPPQALVLSSNPDTAVPSEDPNSDNLVSSSSTPALEAATPSGAATSLKRRGSVGTAEPKATTGRRAGSNTKGKKGEQGRANAVMPPSATDISATSMSEDSTPITASTSSSRKRTERSPSKSTSPNRKRLAVSSNIGSNPATTTSPASTPAQYPTAETDLSKLDDMPTQMASPAPTTASGRRSRRNTLSSSSLPPPPLPLPSIHTQMQGDAMITPSLPPPKQPLTPAGSFALLASSSPASVQGSVVPYEMPAHLAQQQPKKRGRPRKTPLLVDESKSLEKGHAGSQDEDATVAVPSKLSIADNVIMMASPINEPVDTNEDSTNNFVRSGYY